MHSAGGTLPMAPHDECTGFGRRHKTQAALYPAGTASVSQLRQVAGRLSGLQTPVPLLLLERLRNAGLSPEGTVLLMGACYLAIRFGAAWLFKHLTVHRGMFHSLPAALIAAEIVFLAHDCPQRHGHLVLAAGVLLG